MPHFWELLHPVPCQWVWSKQTNVQSSGLNLCALNKVPLEIISGLVVSAWDSTAFKLLPLHNPPPYVPLTVNSLINSLHTKPSESVSQEIILRQWTIFTLLPKVMIEKVNFVQKNERRHILNTTN